MSESEKIPHLTVRGVDRQIYNLFVAACKMQGRRVGDVMEEVLWEYASRVIKKQEKPRG